MAASVARTFMLQPTRCPRCGAFLTCGTVFLAGGKVTIRYEHASGEAPCAVTREAAA